MAVPFDFQARKLLGKPERVIEGISTEEWSGSGQFAVSPDGTTEPILPGRDAFVGEIELSRDGRQLLLHTLRHKRELWSLDLSRGVLSPIDAPGEPYGAFFSADGSTVFYNLIQSYLSAASTRQAPIGGGPSRLLLQGRIAPSSVTPDGKRLFLKLQAEPGSETGADIMVLDLEQAGAIPVRFLNDGANDFDPRVSPDGEWLAYGSDRSGTNQVYLRSLGGGEEWRVSDRGWSPRWAPDSKSLYYLNELSLMRVDLEFDTSIPTISVGPPHEVLPSLSFAEEEEFAVDANGRVAMVELAE